MKKSYFFAIIFFLLVDHYDLKAAGEETIYEKIDLFSEVLDKIN